MRPFALTLLCILCAWRVCEAAPTLRITASVDGQRPQGAWAYVRRGQRVDLHAELRPATRGAAFRWYRLEPTTFSTDNTRPAFHWSQVAYEVQELESCRGQATCPADVSPRRMPRNPHLEGLGTMAFAVEATLPDGRRVSSPGVASQDRGGLSRDVFRVTVRRDDGYLGYLTELVNTPYIFGSAGPEGRHQADLLVGSDCADLAVYGIRRLGKDVPYVSTWTLEKHAPKVAVAETRGAQGALLDARGQPITVGPGGAVKEGDLLLFPDSRHVAVLWEDLPPEGVLDEGDLMIHTCWAPPTVEPIAQSGCASLPVRVLRFR
jgi:hypothetical protein